MARTGWISEVLALSQQRSPSLHFVLFRLRTAENVIWNRSLILNGTS